MFKEVCQNELHPKSFCLTFGVHIKMRTSFFMYMAPTSEAGALLLLKDFVCFKHHDLDYE